MKLLAVLKTILYFCTVVRPIVDAVKGVVSGVEKECKGKKLCIGHDIYNNDMERFAKDNSYKPFYAQNEEGEKE